MWLERPVWLLKLTNQTSLICHFVSVLCIGIKTVHFRFLQDLDKLEYVQSLHFLLANIP